MADGASYVIRKVNRFGIISTIAGSSSYTYSMDGIPATAAQIEPNELAMDDSGQIYVTDGYNMRVYKIDLHSILHCIAGTGVATYSGDGGQATDAGIDDPVGVALDKCGNIYITEAHSGRIRKITYPPTPPVITLSAPASAAIGSTVVLSATITGGCCGHVDSIIWMNKGVAFATTSGNSVTYTKTMNTDSITAKAIGCGDTAMSAVYVVTRNTTSISSGVAGIEEITCYPNPASTLLYVSAGFDIKSLVITNIVGQVVLQSRPASGEPSVIDVAQLPGGVYFVRVNGLWTKRFVKD